MVFYASRFLFFRRTLKIDCEKISHNLHIIFDGIKKIEYLQKLIIFNTYLVVNTPFDRRFLDATCKFRYLETLYLDFYYLHDTYANIFNSNNFPRLDDLTLETSQINTDINITCRSLKKLKFLTEMYNSVEKKYKVTISDKCKKLENIELALNNDAYLHDYDFEIFPELKYLEITMAEDVSHDDIEIFTPSNMIYLCVDVENATIYLPRIVHEVTLLKKMKILVEKNKCSIYMMQLSKNSIRDLEKNSIDNSSLNMLSIFYNPVESENYDLAKLASNLKSLSISFSKNITLETLPESIKKLSI